MHTKAQQNKFKVTLVTFTTDLMNYINVKAQIQHQEWQYKHNEQGFNYQQKQTNGYIISLSRFIDIPWQ